MKEISLSKGLTAKVSDEDFEYLSQWKWTSSVESRGTKVYAIRWSRKSEHGDGKRFKIRMHRVVAERHEFLSTGILCDRSSFVVDHKDDDSLNNTRENLEYVSQEENMQRSGGWKGSRKFKAYKSSTSTTSSTPCNDLPICPLVESLDSSP